jgi:hypothetical protein
MLEIQDHPEFVRSNCSMIPRYITKNHIIAAIKEIKKNGIPPRRRSKKFYLLFEGDSYPPKYVISIAHKFAEQSELDAKMFSGGQETNSFLRRLRFKIITHGK